MIIKIDDKIIIRKVINTLAQLNNYRGRLKSFADYSIKGEEIDFNSPELKTDLLIHFTNLENAQKILNNKHISINEKRYISLTEVDIREFKVVTKAKDREYGFAFLKNDISSNYVLFTPIFANNIDKLIKIILPNKDSTDPLINTLKRLIFVEEMRPQKGTLIYSSIEEIRCLNNLNIKDVILFFRNHTIKEDIELDYDPKNVLNDYGIFKLPYTSEWVKYFTDEQKWLFKEKEQYIELCDDRAATNKTEKYDLLDIKELITKLDQYIN